MAHLTNTHQQHISSIRSFTVGPFLTIFLPQPGDELLWWNDSHFLLLSGDAVEQVSQAGEQALFPPRLDFIGQHFLSEGPAEVQCLQHWVTVAGVAKLRDCVWTEQNRMTKNMSRDVHKNVSNQILCHQVCKPLLKLGLHDIKKIWTLHNIVFLRYTSI